MPDLEDKYCINRRKPTPLDELLLLDECGYIYPSCGNFLVEMKDVGIIILKGRIWYIK